MSPMRRKVLVGLLVTAACLVAPSMAQAVAINVFSANNGTGALGGTTLNLGSTPQAVPRTVDVYLRNTTTGSATITGISVTGTALSRVTGFTNSCGNPNITLTTTNAGVATSTTTNNCILRLQVSAGANPPGVYNGTLTVTSSTGGSGSPIVVNLTSNVVANAPAGELRDTAGTTVQTTRDFGTVVATNPGSSYTYTFFNTGNVPLTAPSTQSITGTDAADFTRSSTTCGATLAVGASCNVVVQFTPQTAGAKTATLNVAPTNAGLPAITTTLTGTADPALPVATLQDTAGTTPKGSHDFGNLVAGNSASYTFTLRNTGNAPLPGPNTQSITGVDASSFSRATTCGATLAINATCTITVTYTPTSAGPKAATLAVSPPGYAQATASLSGTADPALPVTTIQDTAGTSVLATYAFPQTVVTQSSSYVFTIRNTGNSPVTGLGLAAVPLAGADAAHFTRTTTCAASLAVNATCTVTVNFVPASPGAKSAQLQVNAANAPATSVDLSGTAVAAQPSFELRDTGNTTQKTTHDFGTVQAGVGANAQYTFTIRNTGNVPLAGLNAAPSITGTNPSDFTRPSTACGATLAVNASCTFVAQFAPADVNARSATLTQGSTTPGAVAQAVALSGTGGGVLLGNDVNANLTGANHKQWLDTLTAGARSPVGDRLRFSFDAKVQAGRTIEDVLISSSSTQNDTPPGDATFNPIPSTGIGRVAVNTPPGGSTRQHVEAEYPLSNLSGWDTGISDGLLGFCLFQTTKTSNRRVWVRFRDSTGALSPRYGSIIRITDASFACGGAGPIIDSPEITAVDGQPQNPGTRNVTIEPNTPVTFSFVARSRSNNFSGINWRIRNTTTNQIFQKTATGWQACAAPCTGDGGYSVAAGSRIDYPDGGAVQPTRTMTVTFPNRGRWVLEAAPRGSDQDLAHHQLIGSVMVNTNAGSTTQTTSPTITLGGLPPARPDTNSVWNITASVADPLNPVTTFDSQGGRAALIEWDLDNNATNGPGNDGFEDRVVGDPATGLPGSALARTLNLTGKTPGAYTIRARITDNGAVNGADRARASRIVSHTFTVNAPPVADDQLVDVEADEAQPKGVTLTGSDADGDPFTFAVPNPNGNGTVGGSDANRTYTWPATYTGDDTFTFTATDDKNGTGSGTLTMRVRPNTAVDSATPSALATQSQAMTLTYSSPQAPISGYECRLLADGDVVEDWVACDSQTKAYSSLPDASYRFEVRALNGNGHRDPTPAVHEWRVDTTQPEVVWESGPNGPTNDPTPSYVVSADDLSPQATMTYECRVLFGPENGVWKPCGSPVGPTGSSPIDLIDGGGTFGFTDPLTEGTYEFEVRATDEVGLTGPAAKRTFTVDLTPPGTSIASGPEGLINTRDVVFAVTSTEAGSTFRCTLEGATQGVLLNAASCPGGAAPAWTGLADDEYTLTVAAVDPAGNPDPAPPTASFEIDATAPTTTLLDGPPATTTSRRATVDFEGFDVRRLQGFECRLDSSDPDDWSSCEPPETYGGLSDGPHELEIRAFDEAGNRDATPLLVEWTIDLTAPDTAFTVRPDDVDADTTPTIEWAADEASTFQCRLDGAAWAACTSPLTTPALDEGAHTLEVRATDLAGNVEPTPAQLAWKVDSVAPEVAFVAVPDDPSPAGDAEIGFEVYDGSPAALAPEVETLCAVEPDLDDDPSTYDWEPCGTPLVIDDPQTGVHTVAVKAVDAAGNESAVITHEWRLDAEVPVAPVIDASHPENGGLTAQPEVSIAFSHPELDDVTYECATATTAFTECESPYRRTGLADGDHEVRIRAVDGVGNRSPESTFTFTVDSRLPVTTIADGPTGLQRSRTATFAFTSSKGPATYECKLDAGAWTACDAATELTNLADGQHTLRVRAVISAADAQSVVPLRDPSPPSRTWTVDATAPPTTVLSAPAATIPTQSTSMTFASTDPTATFQCKVDDDQYTPCSSPLELRDLREGGHTVLIRAVDPAGNIDETPAEVTFVVRVPEVEPPPTAPSTGGNFGARLTEGALTLQGIAPLPLTADMITLQGSLAADGTLSVPVDGMRFKGISLPLQVGPLNVEAKIILQPLGPATGKLPPGGGAATFSLPVQVKVEAYGTDGTPLLGQTSGCFVGPLQFDLTGTYDAATNKVTVGTSALAVPEAGGGCGALGAQVNTLLGLPSATNAVSLTFTLGDVPPPAAAPPTTTTVASTATTVGLGTLDGNARSGSAWIALRCIGSDKGSCGGVARIVAKVKPKKGRARDVVLSSVSYRMAGGDAVLTRMRLTASARSIVRKAGRKGLKATVQITPTGARTPAIRKTITLKSTTGGSR